MMRRGARARRQQSGSASSVWTPANIPSLIGWYDASSFTAAQWSDKSSAANHLVQNTGANQASLTSTWTSGSTIGNGQQAVQFSGSQFYTKTYASSYTAPTTVFIVCDTTDHSAQRLAYDGLDGTDHYYFGVINTANRGQCGTAAGGFTTLSTPMTVPHIFEPGYGITSTNFATTPTASANTTMCAFDGVANNSAAGVVPALKGLVVGQRYDGTLRYVGRIAILLIYNANLNLVQRQAVRSWINTTYGLGLTLP